MDINGASAVVTGGASGLGFAAAQALVEAGARVVVVDLPTSRGEEAVARLDGRAVFVPSDVADPKGVEDALDRAESLGRFRVAVNCAGIGTPGRTVGRNGPLALDDFVSVITVNLVGTFNVIRLAAQRMAEATVVEGERGVIVNTASVSAFEGQIGQAAYAASKGGVVGMTLPIARDLAGLLIRVVSIAPGLFLTPMLNGVPDEVRASLGAQVPHPSRLGDPAEFGALVAHVVANPMLNGETIRLDGAIRLAPR